MKNNKKMMILSFFGIIFVVLGHTSYSINLMGNFFPFYSFHMVLFVFISGYFYKVENINKLFGKNGYIFRKIKRLLIPYFVWNLIYGVIINFFNYFKIVDYGSPINFKNLFINPWKYGSQFYLNIASWFMLALFVVNIVYVLMRKVLCRIWNDYFMLLLFLIMSLISVKFSTKIENEPIIIFVLFRTMFFMFFYHLGFVYKIKFENKVKINNWVYLLLILFIQIVTMMIDKNLSYNVIFMRFPTKYFYTPILSGLTGIFFWLKISEILIPIFGEDKFVNCVSNNTFSIMLHHLFWLFIINTIIYYISGPLNLTDFDINQYKNTIYYIYIPGVYVFSFIYSLLIIVLPVIFKMNFDYIKTMLTKEKN